MKIQFNKTTGRYELVNGNMLVKAYVSRKDLQNYIDQNDITISEEVDYIETGIDIPKFSINQRFDFVKQLTDMVLDNHVKSFVLSGPGGIGKSYELTRKLLEKEYREDIDYVTIKGALTAKGLFDIFKNNSTKLIILDDTDDSLKDQKAVNLIKAAVDTTGEKRTISWVTTEGIDQVEFTGQIIFITNLPKQKVPQPILSRSFMVDLHMTPSETIERLEFILPNMDTDLPIEQRRECLELLNEYREITRDLNARTLLKLFAIRANGEQTGVWRELATYSLIS